MTCVYASLLFLFFALSIDGSHFRGGTITWKPISNNVGNASKVSVMITQTYSWTKTDVPCTDLMISAQSPAVNLSSRAGSGSKLICITNCSTAGGYVGNEVPITGYCTDYSIPMSLTVSQRSDIVNLTVGAYFTAAFNASGGWQTLALGSSSGWTLSVTIDLRPRSDTGLINIPPVATCISFISIPANIQQKIQIPVLDADDDYIKCRFATGFYECYNTCPPGSLPAGTSISASCVLTITGPTAGVYYLVALQVEDFISNTSTTRLSSVPIQFLIYVYNSTSCSLKPLLLSNFEAGSCQGAQVGQIFTMEFVVINRCGSGRTISDIGTLSFPIVLKGALIQNTTNTTIWTMKITWIPTVNEVGSQVFCAVAIDSASVQSDQLCTTISVGLNSVPICPGATAPTTTTSTTTTTATTTTVTTSTTTTTTATTTTTTVTTTTTTTTMTTTTTTVTTTTVTTATASLTSVEKPKASIDWPLIVGLSLLALLLAICCSICCWFYFMSKHRRRRAQSHRVTENMLEVERKNHNIAARFLKQLTGKQSYKRKIGTSATSNSSGSSIAMIELDREKTASHVTSADDSKPIPDVRSTSAATTSRIKSVTVKKISRQAISAINSETQKKS